MVNTAPEWLFFNLILVTLTFFLFIFLISVFGYIFFYFLKKINKKDWDINFLEIFLISFGIGLSIYISLSFILDIFHVFNFYSAYFSLIIIDILFVLFLIYRKKLTREKVADFIDSIKKRFKNKPHDSIFLIIIVIFIIFIQVAIQWRVITQEYALPSLDTYGWMGHMWHLLEKGHIWRARHGIHYPRGFVIFTVAPVLINPDFGFAYLYFKFAGIPLMSFYIIIMATLLKRIFKKNYLVLIGLVLTLMSNILFSRFCLKTASTIPTVMILATLIILRSKCPFYLTAFFIQLMFLFNPLYAFGYIIVWGLLILFRLISKHYPLRVTLIEYTIKPIILILILLLTFVFHTMIVLNITFIELLNAFSIIFGIPTINLSKNLNLLSLNMILLNFDFSDILKDLLPNNDVISIFRDLEKRVFSLFIIFTFIGLFLPTKRYFGKKNRDLINFGKFSLIVILGFYVGDLLLSESPTIFTQSLIWFIFRIVEAFVGPIIIFCCFIIELIIKKANIITLYLRNNYPRYKNLLKSSKFFKIENIVITILLISVFSTFIVHRNVYYHVYFEEEHFETIFYIKDNIPEDSKILVHFYDDYGDALHSLLSTYKLYDWEFSANENDIIEIKQYIRDKNIKYVLLDLEKVSSTELNNFTCDTRFENLYENNVFVLFEYEDCYFLT